jgi:hypothetical protein
MLLRGLFIGIDRFADPKIRDLGGCRRDALALSSLFKDTIPDLQSVVLVDNQATLAAVRNALTEVLANAGPEDTVIISFSSHGTPDHRLVVHDSLLSALPSSTVDMAEISQAFKQCKAKVILFILDCCFSGGAPARVLEDAPSPRAITIPLDAIAGAGRVLIAASGVNEPALEFNRHGLLTFALMEALQAETDSVSVPSVVDHVMARVRVEAERQGYTQTPVLFGYVEGGLVLPALRRGPLFYKEFPEFRGIRVTPKIADLAAFGLPSQILKSWEDEFPNGLNDLQLQAVNDHRVLDGNSLFVVAPTSSGKTFIGELAAAKAAAEGRKAVFLFPYRALVNEKFDYFSRVYGEAAGMRIVRCTGDYLDQASAFIRGKFDIAVLTYEMYLSLAVANPATLDTLGILVVDEVQFIANPRRGIVVELLLTNLLAARNRGISAQVVTLSAVIGGENDFDAWLGASKLVVTKRPVRQFALPGIAYPKLH